MPTYATKEDLEFLDATMLQLDKEFVRALGKDIQRIFGREPADEKTVEEIAKDIGENRRKREGDNYYPKLICRFFGGG